MTGTEYRDLLKTQVENTIKQATGRGDQQVEIDDEQYRNPDGSSFASEATQVIGSAATNGPGPIIDVLLKVSTPWRRKPSGLYQSYARAGKVTRVVTQQQAKSLLDKVKLWVKRLNKDYPDKAFAVQYQHNNPDAFVEIRCAINLEGPPATQSKTTNPPQFFCEACLMSFDDDRVREVHERVCRQIYDPPNWRRHK